MALPRPQLNLYPDWHCGALMVLPPGSGDALPGRATEGLPRAEGAQCCVAGTPACGPASTQPMPQPALSLCIPWPQPVLR